MLNKAREFAYRHHKGQTRKAKTIPFTNHLDLVYEIAQTLTDDKNILSAAWLHDVVEDTDVTIEDIEREFGHHIRKYVDIESENKLSEKPASDTWRTRKESQLAILRNLKENKEVLIIALSDKIANLLELKQDIYLTGDKVWERFNNKNPDDHKWYHSSFLEIFENNRQIFVKNERLLDVYKQLIEEVFEERNS